jgi:prophage regulatory protein
MTTQTKKPLRILRAPALHDKTGLKKSHIQQLEAKGKFPKRIKLGEHASGWLEHEVDAWLEARIAASRPSPSPATALNGAAA